MRTFIKIAIIACVFTATSVTSSLAQGKYTAVKPDSKINNKAADNYPTLYTLNGTPKTCEDNLKNLIQTLTPYKRPEGAIGWQFVGYTSLGKVEESQIESYLDRLTSMTASIMKGKITFKKEGAVTQRTDEISYTINQATIDATPEDEKEAIKAKFEKQMAKKRNVLKTQLKAGLEAYLVRADKGNGLTMQFLVFCDPKTKQITVDPNFKNITLVFEQAD